jgi:hypothetical protein
MYGTRIAFYCLLLLYFEDGLEGLIHLTSVTDNPETGSVNTASASASSRNDHFDFSGPIGLW